MPVLEIHCHCNANSSPRRKPVSSASPTVVCPSGGSSLSNADPCAIVRAQLGLRVLSVGRSTLRAGLSERRPHSTAVRGIALSAERSFPSTDFQLLARIGFDQCGRCESGASTPRASGSWSAAANCSASSGGQQLELIAPSLVAPEERSETAVEALGLPIRRHACELEGVVERQDVVCKEILASGTKRLSVSTW